MKAIDIKRELSVLGSPERARASVWYFKTGPGQYAEGDVFIGIPVPQQRKVAKKYALLPFSEISELLKSSIHEHRFVALEILVMQYEVGTNAVKKNVADFYLKHTKYINNWDLVDTSASYILGDYLLDKNKEILFRLAKSKNLWERRIAIISTLGFIKEKRFTESLKIAEMLLSDNHDLIHKAVGWVLRELGKVSLKDELNFLDQHSAYMPRTMLRYAIEKFSKTKRKYYLNLKNEKSNS